MPLYPESRKAGSVPANPASLPEIDKTGCVRSRLVVASCSACVGACPQDALFEGEDGSLLLHADACTACGACVAACAETAINLPRARRGRAVQGNGPRLTLVCARHPAADNADALPCLHCLGLADLARLWQAGLRRLVTASADCRSCDLCPPVRLADQLERFNTLTRSRGLAVITHHRAGPKALVAWRDDHPPRSAPDNSRRNFLRGLAAPAQPDTPEPSDSAGLADFLEQGSPETTPVFPFSPQIDPAMCTACDACTRVCPHDALILVNDKSGQGAYETTASACTGCGLCVDICDEDAITVAQMTGPGPDLPLDRYRCKACGNWQSIFAGTLPEDGLCRICRVNNSRRNLFVKLP